MVGHHLHGVIGQAQQPGAAVQLHAHQVDQARKVAGRAVQLVRLLVRLFQFGFLQPQRNGSLVFEPTHRGRAVPRHVSGGGHVLLVLDCYNVSRIIAEYFRHVNG